MLANVVDELADRILKAERRLSLHDRVAVVEYSLAWPERDRDIFSADYSAAHDGRDSVGINRDALIDPQRHVRAVVQQRGCLHLADLYACYVDIIAALEPTDVVEICI